LAKGKFIVLEGPEGSGKTTQVARLALRLGEESCVVRVVREPGGTAIGEQIRKVLLDKENGKMTVGTELLLYMACRAQLVHEVIRPALDEGLIVLADRFLTSSIVYQGIAGGMGAEEIEQLYRATCGDVAPDLVVVLDVSAEVGLLRLQRSFDRMESKPVAFHRRVRKGYLAVAKSDPGRHAVVDASKDVNEVAEAVWQEVKRRVLS
jgi:dTMP kinase